MRAAVSLLVGLFVYAVSASDNLGGSDPKKSTRQYEIVPPQGYRPIGYQPQSYRPIRYQLPPKYYRPIFIPPPVRRLPPTKAPESGFFDDPITLILFLLLPMLSKPPTSTMPSTTAPATTPAPATTMPTNPVTTMSTASTTTTTASSTLFTTTPDPFASWPQFTNCRYKVEDTPLNYDDAKARCVELGAKLASAGFNVELSQRQTLVGLVGAGALSFWVAVSGIGSGTVGNEPTGVEWEVPEDGDPKDAPVSIALEDATDDAGTVCGRFRPHDLTTLFFEPCDDGKHYFICEICGSSA